MRHALLHSFIGLSLLIRGMVFIRWTAHANPPNGGFPIERVSVANNGAESDEPSTRPAVNRAGRYVAFTSIAPLVANDTNGVTDIFVRDTESGATQRVPLAPLYPEGTCSYRSFNVVPKQTRTQKVVLPSVWE